MAAIAELISTYLTACEVEGRTANTVTAYRATLRDFRRVGERPGLADAVESCVVPDVYAGFDHAARCHLGRSAAVPSFFSPKSGEGGS
jgi:site-specific recombinase XerD